MTKITLHDSQEPFTPRPDRSEGFYRHHMEAPDDLEIPRFLEPEPDPLIPDELHSLSEPGETVREMQARLWLLYLELQNKVMMALASREEIRLHTTLHGHLNWLAPPLEGDL